MYNSLFNERKKLIAKKSKTVKLTKISVLLNLSLILTNSYFNFIDLILNPNDFVRKGYDHSVMDLTCRRKKLSSLKMKSEDGPLPESTDVSPLRLAIFWSCFKFDSFSSEPNFLNKVDRRRPLPKSMAPLASTVRACNLLIKMRNKIISFK